MIEPLQGKANRFTNQLEAVWNVFNERRRRKIIFFPFILSIHCSSLTWSVKLKESGMHNVKSMFIFGNIENYSGTSGLRRKDTQIRG